MVNVPFSGIQVTPTELEYGNFQTGYDVPWRDNPDDDNRQLYFGFDAGEGHWSMSAAPKGSSNSAGISSKSSRCIGKRQISINNFYFSAMAMKVSLSTTPRLR